MYPALRALRKANNKGGVGVPDNEASVRQENEAKRELGRLIEDYEGLKNPSKKKALRRIDRTLTRLEIAYGQHRARRILEEFGFTERVIRVALKKATQSGTLDAARPHFYLALDHCNDPQVVRDMFFIEGIQLLDTRVRQEQRRQVASCSG